MHTQNKSSVFITGASGFIGANIVRFLLKKNYAVHILNRVPKLPWRLIDLSESLIVHIGDLTEYRSIKSALEKSQPDYIIHLAAYGAYSYQTDMEKIVQVNIEGTVNLLEASKDIPYKCFINTGSSSEYGFKNEPMKEDDYCDPVSYYAATKLSTTHLCKVFAKLNNKPIITFRLFSVYGPYEEPTRFIPVIMTALIKKKPIKITPGIQRRDFIHIDDVTHAYFQGMNLRGQLHGQVFNIGTGAEKSNDEIVDELFNVTGKKTAVLKGAYPSRTWDTTHWVADISKSRDLLKWQPSYTTEHGLKNTFNWFTNNLKYYTA